MQCGSLDRGMVHTLHGAKPDDRRCYYTAQNALQVNSCEWSPSETTDSRKADKRLEQPYPTWRQGCCDFLRKEKSKLAMGKAREDSLPEQPGVTPVPTVFSAAAGSRGWFPGRTESVALVEAQEAKIKAILGHQGCRFLGNLDLSIVCEVSAKLALFPREPTLPFYLQRSPKHLRPAMMAVGKEERNAACWL